LTSRSQVGHCQWDCEGHALVRAADESRQRPSFSFEHIRPLEGGVACPPLSGQGGPPRSGCGGVRRSVTPFKKRIAPEDSQQATLGPCQGRAVPVASAKGGQCKPPARLQTGRSRARRGHSSLWPRNQHACAGGRRLVFRDTWVTPDRSLAVGYEEGGGLGATRLLLSRSLDRPEHYSWPPAPPSAARGGSGLLPAWAAAVIAVAGSFAAVVAAALELRRRRRRRQRRQLQPQAALGPKGAAHPRWLPRRLGGSKGGACARSDEEEGDAAAPAAAGGGAAGADDGDDDTRLARDAGRRLARAAAALAPRGGAGRGPPATAAGSLEEGGSPALLPLETPAAAAAVDPAVLAGSGPADVMEGRWRELSRKIGRRIGMIHMSRVGRGWGWGRLGAGRACCTYIGARAPRACFWGCPCACPGMARPRLPRAASTQRAYDSYAGGALLEWPHGSGGRRQGRPPPLHPHAGGSPPATPRSSSAGGAACPPLGLSGPQLDSLAAAPLAFLADPLCTKGAGQ
jgi:hypothetical protein